jgi:hypothetical protein
MWKKKEKKIESLALKKMSTMQVDDDDLIPQTPMQLRNFILTNS